MVFQSEESRQSFAVKPERKGSIFQENRNQLCIISEDLIGFESLKLWSLFRSCWSRSRNKQSVDLKVLACILVFLSFQSQYIVDCQAWRSRFRFHWGGGKEVICIIVSSQDRWGKRSSLLVTLSQRSKLEVQEKKMYLLFLVLHCRANTGYMFVVPSSVVCPCRKPILDH